jgi:DNA polymerase V
MSGSGIHDGDMLVIDRSLTPEDGDVIVGVLDGDHLIATYVVYEGKKYLVPDNPSYEEKQIHEGSTFTLEGVVPHTILDQRRQRNVRANRLQQLLCERRKGVSTASERPSRRSA